MPLFEFLCLQCGQVNEILVTTSADQPSCGACGSSKMKKMLSAHSSFSGVSRRATPGPGDTACCGSAPGQAAGCMGPGSCCGKGPS